MTDNEKNSATAMSDNEIINLLECCKRSQCSNCEYGKQCDGYTQVCYALDLINRQKAEIEKLKAENENQNLFEQKMWIALILQSAATNSARTEAIKELMFNLDEEINTYSSNGKDLNVYAWLKNYAKEKIGE